MTDDARLLTAAAAGDDVAFERWLAAIRPELLRYAADRLGGDRADAEDVLQDAAVRALLALRDGRVPANPRAWMYVIVRNRCHDVRGARRAHQPLDDAYAVSATTPGPDEHAAARRRLDAVVTAVGALPDSQRRALVSATLEGRPYEEIAAREATSVQAVKSLVHRARRGLEASGARAASVLPGLWAFRLRVRGLGGAGGEALGAMVSQHAATVAGVAAVAAAAVPAVVERPPAPRASSAPAAASTRDSAKAAAQACRDGASLTGYTARALVAAQREISASDAEYAATCAPRLVQAALVAG